MTTTISKEFIGEQIPQGFMIVGIGASAGGIQALKDFFHHVPSDSGMAYVVILHLSPDHDSRLAQVLQQVSAIPVLQVLEKTTIEPNHIYVVPPNQHLVMDDGYIAPSMNVKTEDRRAPVDIFFRHLADVYGPRAICVVLSGTGANGSMGLKRVKERGGAAYVQNPREAEFNEMPRNSIATELVDEILNVAEIPARIITYSKNLGLVRIVAEPENRTEQQQQALREIFTQLRVRTGHDFSNYKRPTLLRRIERRINIRNLPDLPSYMGFIHEHPDETHALLKDLLISVTNFFRDPKAFAVLETDVLPQILRNKTAEDQVRIWVAGCATGEEAYSLAVLCSEQLMAGIDSPKVQIFATDIDEAAIAVAREGYYTLNDAADVSPDRLRRFFHREGDGYRVRRELREMILFAHHNFLKDPPFSKLDLITCRNVLIYLNNTAQERVIETFHFALKPKGYLFLGTSESVDGSSDLYTTLNRDHHIFQAREVSARYYPTPESVPTLHFPNNDRQEKLEQKDGRNHRISFGELHQKLLEQYAPPSVIVNEEYDIVHLTDRVGKYLEFAGGEPSKNLLKLVRPEIRLELRSALYHAVQNKTAVEARRIPVTINGQQQLLEMHIRPVVEDGDTAKGFILVIFKTADEVVSENGTVVLPSDEPVARHLEEELIRLKTQLRNSIEQHEYQSEELKASNEELQAMNEELRSAAEELETSKEELQSINEELRTVNQELKVKIDETSLVSNNLQNLINSANVGTIFLDRSFAIRLFTPAVLDIFNMKSGDYGRPISDITNKLQYDGLLHDAETVLEKLSIVEREVTSSDNRFFMLRILPYRTSEDRINGVVITFYDITNRKQSENALKHSEDRFRTLADVVPQLIWTTTADGEANYFNQRWYEFSGLSVEQSKGPGWQSIVHPEDSPVSVEKWKKAFEAGEIFDTQYRLRARDGSYIWFIARNVPLRDESGKITIWFGTATDIENLKKTEAALSQSETRLKITLESATDYAIITMDPERKVEKWSKGAAQLLGYTEAEMQGESADIIFTEEDRVAGAPVQEMESARDTGRAADERWHQRKDGSRFFGSGVLRPIQNGELTGYVKIMRDITQQQMFTEELHRQVKERTIELQRSNEDLRQFAHVASHDLKEPVRKIQTFNNRILDEYQDVLPPKVKTYSAKIGTAAERMVSMIEGVLHYSKLDNSEQVLEDIDLNAIIEQVINDLELLIAEKQAQITAINLPILKGNPTLLYQLFYNLILNSLKFSRESERSQVQITSKALTVNNEPFVEISVADNGIGFEQEFAQAIFKSFARLHRPEEYEGTGLGLALCKKIVERHGGTITAKGEPDKGATFAILLPLRN